MFRSLEFSLLLVLGTAVVVAGGNEELTGVITQVKGTVELSGEGVTRVPVAVPWQVVRAGVILKVPEGGAAGVVCSNLRFVRIGGDTTWRLTEPACAKGKALTISEYTLLVPRGGRFKFVRGLMVLEREMRGQEVNPLAPIVLSPRNTGIRSSRPSIRWLAVPKAVEYQIEWSGRGADAFTLRLQDWEVSCGRDGLGICELPWPASRPNLPAGGTFFLTVAARNEPVAPWHKLDSVEVRTIEADEAVRIEERLRDLEALGLEGSSFATARAGVLAQAELYTEAVESCQEAIELTNAASLKLALADIHLVTGLLHLAQELYRDALEDRESVIRAAAAFGIGRIEHAQARYHEAVWRFRQAHDLYRALGLPEEEAAARTGIERAEARIPR